MIPDIDLYILIRTVSEANRGNEHWGAKSTRHKKQKKAVNLAFAGPTRTKLIKLGLPLRIELIRTAPRALDIGDNLPMSLKPIRDYLADIIIPGKQIGRADDSKQITWSYDQVKGDPLQYAVSIKIFKV